MGVLYQVLCTGVACYLCMTVSLMLTWPSCTLKLFSSENTTLSRPMVETETALLGSLASIGALIGTPLAGYFLDIIGRKYCALACASMYLVAWSIIAAFKQVEVILLAIFISGIGGAVAFVVPLFICEICQESIRGSMTSGSMIFYGVGMLVSYLLGGCLEYYTLIYVFMTVSAVGVIMLLFVKETPTFLMKRGLEKDAAISMAFYRNAKVDSKEVMQEMDSLRRAFNPDLEQDGEPETLELEMLKSDTVEAPKKLSVWKFLKKSRSTRQAVFVTLTLITAATFQGLVVLQVYAEPLFEEAVPNISPTVCSVIMAAIGIIAGLIAAYLTDLAGRRPLMIYSSMASAVCCLTLATQLQFHWAPHWMTAVIIYSFMVSNMFGAGTVPFVLVAEVFLPEVKSIMSMVVMEWAWLCNFIILFIFSPLVSLMGLGPVFYIFAGICLFSGVFAIIYLPETKGIPVDVIQLAFSKRRRGQKC